MLNLDRNPTPNQTGDVPFYVNWFGKDVQDLKRGGTAPTTDSRKIKNFRLDNIYGAGLKDGQPKQKKIIATVYKSMEGSQKQLDPKEESAYKRSIQTVSKIYNSSTGFQNKPRRPFADTKSSYIPVMTTSGMNSPVFTTNGTNIGQRKFSASNKTTESYASQGGMARPQTSHKKASSAFRRDRIMNETGNEGEEYTPNTGNLELESLQQVNIDSDRSNGSYDKNFRTNGDSDKYGKQRKGGQGDRYEKEKYEELTKTKSNQFLDVHDSSDGSYSDDENQAKYSKARQILESRKYTEDYKNLDIVDLDSESNRNTNRSHKNANGSDRQKHNDKENIVSMLGRALQETTTTDKNDVTNLRNDEQDGHKSLSMSYRNQAGQDEEFGSVQNFPPFTRPPTRKVGTAMNLDERAQTATEEVVKKPIVVTNIKPQQIIRVRPPSRHKTPNKALGLELPDNEKKEEKSESSLSLFEDNEPLDTKKENDDNDSDFLDEFKNDNMGFDNVLDLSDFHDTEEVKPAPQKFNRPQTREGERKINTAIAQTRNHKEFVSIGTVEKGPVKVIPAFTEPNKISIQAKTKNFFETEFSKPEPFAVPNDKPQSRQNSQSFTRAATTTINNRSLNKEANESVTKTNSNKPKIECLSISEYLGDFDGYNHFPDPPSSNNYKKSHPQSAKQEAKKSERSSKNNNYLDQFSCSYKDEKSKIVFTHNKSSVTNKKGNPMSLPFETSLGKDFVGLFAS